MNKQDIQEFFDRLAPGWDRDMIRSDTIIGKILDGANIHEGMDILDVACGTGVLFCDYLARNVRSITAIDLSSQMAKIAREKFPQANVICGDVEVYPFDKQFDAVMVYNAFPHFPEPENLIRVLSGLLKPGGTLTIAHGMSRHQIDHHHEGAASKVSRGLMHEDELAAIMGKYLPVTVKISNDHMYQVTAKKAEFFGASKASSV